MKFRDDIDPANTWVVSDTHFGHENIVGFCHRPLDHDAVMIAEWRKEIPDDATVVHLGDLTYRGNARFKHIVAKELTGRDKKLVLGNHDKQGMSFYKKCGFQVCRPFKIEYFMGLEECRSCWGTGQMESSDSGDESWWDCRVCKGTGKLPKTPYTVSFSHYPWGAPDDEGKQPENHIRLHGHIHNNGYTREAFVPFLKNHINLSVEQTKYKPVNLKLLLDAALLGVYPETTQASLNEARTRKEAHNS